MLEPSAARAESFGSLDSPSHSMPLPMHVMPWTGGQVMKSTGSGMPDLLSEDDVDEDVERFMTILPNPDKKETYFPLCSAPRQNRSNDDKQLPCVGSPTPLRRTQGLKNGRSLQEEEDMVIQWLRENLGKANVESQIQRQQQMVNEWKENHAEESGIPPPVVLQRNNSIDGNATYLDFPQREGLARLPFPEDEEQDKQPLQACSNVRPPIALQRRDRIGSNKAHPDILKRKAPPVLPIFEDDNEMQHQADGNDTKMHDDDATATASSTKAISASVRGRVELYPGKHVNIHGQDRVYDSLRNGDGATMVQCLGCEQKLLSTQDATTVLCDKCGTRTPTDMKCEVKDDSELFES